MTRESLAAWMLLCVPVWSGLAAWNLSRPSPADKIVGALMICFAVAGLMGYFTSVLSMAVRA